MFTGRTIDELINTVERAERQVRSRVDDLAPKMAPRREIFPAFSTYMYDFASMNRAAVGVA